MIDEIQHVPEFEDVLNSYLLMKNVDVYVTGSNARFLSKDVITTFRGRGYEIKVHPLSFSEYYPISGLSMDGSMGAVRFNFRIRRLPNIWLCYSTGVQKGTFSKIAKTTDKQVRINASKHFLQSFSTRISLKILNIAIF